MEEVLKKIEKEINDYKELSKKIQDERWQAKIKGYKPSTAVQIERRIEDESISNYINGLTVAKTLIESEMNKNES